MERGDKMFEDDGLQVGRKEYYLFGSAVAVIAWTTHE